MRQCLSLTIAISIYLPCVFPDLLGPTYPPPQDLASDQSLVSAAWANLTSILETYLNASTNDTASLSGPKSLTFSLGMFSVRDETAAEALQFHHTSAEVANSTYGINQVDGDSIYRVASITKLITILAGELELSTTDWERPITDFVPTLAAFSQENPGEDDPANVVQWDTVTLAALASQIAGVPRDVLPYDPNDYLLIASFAEFDPTTTFGLPPVNESDPTAFPPCSLRTDGLCPWSDYAVDAQARPPYALPWATPAYSDFGFMLLGLAISNITGKSIDQAYQDSIFQPLDMTSSNSTVPDNSTWKDHVIPGEEALVSFTPEGVPTVTVPSGGCLSTTNDLAKLGTGILNSSLLPADQTRRWMKPITHTSRFEYSVGKPWEIHRYTFPGTDIITDMYTKSGDSGQYGGFLVLLPDFDAGFSIIGASSLPSRSPVTALITDLIVDTMLPALLAQAEAEAMRNYAGTYVPSNASADLNTTLTIRVNETEGAPPGLVLSSFISNGTDVLESQVYTGPSPFRLLPTIWDDEKQIAFRVSPSRKATRGPTEGSFQRLYNVGFDWLEGDSPAYGGIGIGLFFFDLDEDDGSAVAVTPAAWRVKLQKSES
ncbi:MAG: hypothetical protein Q9183_004397 [Haloplaca sp. 2 TL-2023]